MLRVYIIVIILSVLGGCAYAAKYYYDTTQSTIAQLRDNNAKLEVANQENQQTIKKMGEKLFDIQDKLTEGEYLEMMNLLMGVTRGLNEL